MLGIVDQNDCKQEACPSTAILQICACDHCALGRIAL